jgi:hypothetical protein
MKSPSVKNTAERKQRPALSPTCRVCNCNRWRHYEQGPYGDRGMMLRCSVCKRECGYSNEVLSV